MPKNKRQHYVPQFYQRFFSNGEDCLPNLNLISGEINWKSSINRQAQSDYFYGKDNGMEEFLDKEIETPASNVLKNIIKNACINEINNNEYIILMKYIALQFTRTKKMSRDLNTLTNKSTEEFIRYYSSKDHPAGELKQKLGVADYHKKKAPLITTIAGMGILHNFLDLECCLLANNSGEGFITSDSPVTVYNQFLYKKKSRYIIGLKYAGLQIFFPLSPHLMIYLYDRNVYRHNYDQTMKIVISSKEDIKSLNILQAINADNIVMFNADTNSECYMNKIFIKAQSFRSKMEARVDVSNINSRSPVIVEHIVHPLYRLNLSFIKERKSAKRIKVKENYIPLRDGLGVNPFKEIEHIKL